MLGSLRSHQEVNAFPKKIIRKKKPFQENTTKAYIVK